MLMSDQTTADWPNGGPCIYCAKDHPSQFCHIIDDEDEVTQTPSQTTK